MKNSVRAFLSVDISDPVIITRITYLQKKLDQDSARIKFVEKQNIHFTFRFFGETSLDKIEKICDALSNLEFKQFPILLEGIGAFPSIRRPNVVWIGVTENKSAMLNLKEKIDALLAKLSYAPEPKFKAHATIARIRRVTDRERLVANLEALQNETVGTMIVSSIKLKKSTLTPRGPIYETLWELHGK